MPIPIPTLLSRSPLAERIASRVLASAVGPHRRLTLPHLIRLFQEAAMRNTDRLGISSGDLMKAHGLTWVLHRQLITARAWPIIGDAVTVITAPTHIERGLMTYRDFHLIDEAGTPLISSTSVWSVMQFDSRRLRHIPPVVTALAEHMPPPEARLTQPSQKIRVPEASDAERSYRVGFAHLDFNDHLTNPAFAELMVEPLDINFLTTHLPTRADIVYRHEARYGDQLTATVAAEKSQPDTFTHTLRREAELLSIMRSEWAVL
ncbi:acyl-ACP thioesterase domain-containing protein [Lewinella sp. JB7]|uniref:acyl-[acyl-carrier-protein] thioesterase n=1 Tax=Lewinella sp. JB7 TaxID=2962887 RepID=UPI0020C9F848|nr:thioesterase [Lewinella sp. JB7]